ncbi:hypothetical protein VP1G_07374 [Cytospora mali]|uniref:Major facilitator superfamily (MFS) profile domain-containing protein n=1 Tax=Cytospora mali TaxID=578113 RepID=A0A194V813_CYTMA|nr:hypothetical protein VP1G_07374 [Valsa mali var. pyri (nom. inval.)]
MATVTFEDESRAIAVEDTRDTGLNTTACHNSQYPCPEHYDPEKGDQHGPPSEPIRTSKKPLSFYFAFLSLLMMVLIVSLDATILAVALPEISSELGGTTLQAFWASLVLTLAVVVVQPIYTSVSNVMGRKVALHTAFVLFAVGSIVFAVSPTMGILIFGRAIQGLGGGGLDVLSEVITADITTLKERAFWVGMLSVPMAAGCILGPILGAVFSNFANWRWIGWINLPLVAIAMALAVMFMCLKRLETSFMSRLAKIDWIGMAIFHNLLRTRISAAELGWRDLSASFQIISGLGIGTVFVVPCIPMQASASAADQGLAGGIMVSFRLFGALIGLAIGSTTFNNVYSKAIAGVPLPPALQGLTDPNAAVALIQNLRDLNVSQEVLNAIREAYRVSMTDIFIILAAFGVLGFISSLFVQELSMETDELGDQHYEY